MPSKEYAEESLLLPPPPMSQSAAWLCEALRGACGPVLVLDCRSQAAFQRAHVRGAINVTLPSLMLRRLANGTLSLAAAIKCSESRERFSKSWKTHTIVLYDDEAVSSPSPTTSSVLAILLRRLQQDGCLVALLEGGFETFQAQFPEWCRVEGGVGSDSPVLGLQNLRITGCPLSDSDSSEDDACDSSLGREGDELSSASSSADDSPFPVEILPNLFLGNARNSADQAALQRHRIRYILNVTPNLPNRFAQEPGIKYMQIPISDHWSQDLARFFPDAIAFIDEARQQQVGVLVHCLAGISRSVTITVAYLMHKLGMSLNDAYDFVKQRKANISPNFNFMGQLLDFERQLNRAPGRCPLCAARAAAAVELQLQQQQQQQQHLAPPPLLPQAITSPLASPCGCSHFSPSAADGLLLPFGSPARDTPDSGIGFDGWS